MRPNYWQPWSCSTPSPTEGARRAPLAQLTTVATPPCTSPHPTLYTFPKAFLSNSEVPYGEPYRLRPYGDPASRSHVRSARGTLFYESTVRIKGKAWAQGCAILLVTPGTEVEESRKGSEARVSRRGRQRRQVDCTWCVLSPAHSSVSRGNVGVCFAHDGLHTDCVYIPTPTTEMFYMPFTELLESMHQASAWFSSWAHPRS
jgi:hypothetical protein